MLAAEIEVWRFRLRIERVRLACIKFQERSQMPEIKRPMELAGLKSRLVRAQMTEMAIADTGKRYDKVLDEIDGLHATSRSHVGMLELYKSDLASTINRMTGGSNGGDPLEESDGRDSAGAEKPAADPVKPSPAAQAETQEAPAGASAEELTRRVG